MHGIPHWLMHTHTKPAQNIDINWIWYVGLWLMLINKNKNEAIITIIIKQLLILSCPSSVMALSIHFITWSLYAVTWLKTLIIHTSRSLVAVTLATTLQYIWHLALRFNWIFLGENRHGVPQNISFGFLTCKGQKNRFQINLFRCQMLGLPPTGLCRAYCCWPLLWIYNSIKQYLQNTKPAHIYI